MGHALVLRYLGINVDDTRELTEQMETAAASSIRGAAATPGRRKIEVVRAWFCPMAVLSRMVRAPDRPAPYSYSVGWAPRSDETSFSGYRLVWDATCARARRRRPDSFRGRVAVRQGQERAGHRVEVVAVWRRPARADPFTAGTPTTSASVARCCRALHLQCSSARTWSGSSIC